MIISLKKNLIFYFLLPNITFLLIVFLKKRFLDLYPNLSFFESFCISFSFISFLISILFNFEKSNFHELFIFLVLVGLFFDIWLEFLKFTVKWFNFNFERKLVKISIILSWVVILSLNWIFTLKLFVFH